MRNFKARKRGNTSSNVFKFQVVVSKEKDKVELKIWRDNGEGLLSDISSQYIADSDELFGLKTGLVSNLRMSFENFMECIKSNVVYGEYYDTLSDCFKNDNKEALISDAGQDDLFNKAKAEIKAKADIRSILDTANKVMEIVKNKTNGIDDNISDDDNEEER